MARSVGSLARQPLRKTGWAVLSIGLRVLVATAGSYLFSYRLAAASACALPMDSREAALLAALLSVFPMVAIAIWAFAARRAREPAILLSLAWLILSALTRIGCP